MLTTPCVLTMNNSLTKSSNYSAPNSCSVSLSKRSLCTVRTNICRCYTALLLFSESSHSSMPVWTGGDNTHTHSSHKSKLEHWIHTLLLSELKGAVKQKAYPSGPLCQASAPSPNPCVILNPCVKIYRKCSRWGKRVSFTASWW